MHNPLPHFRRHHHLCVSVAKQVFLKANGTLAIAHHQSIRIDDARKLGLAPVALFAVSTFGAPLYWAKLASLDDIPSLSEVLREAWETAAGLRGCPDAVIVTEYVAAAAPALHASLETAGIELLVGTDSKAHAAVLRTMQDKVVGIVSRVESARPDLSAFAKEVATYHSYINLESAGSHKGCMELWLNLSRRDSSRSALRGAVPIELGNWATSWELTLPPARPLVLYDLNGITRISERQDAPESDSTNADFEDEPSEQIGYEDDIASTAKRLLDCWPNDLTEVAHTIGTTVRQLRWFLAGHEAIAGFPSQRLSEILSLEPDEQGDITTEGPYVFLAKGAVKATQDLFRAIAGDYEYFVEVIPLFGSPDPSFRYILFARCFEPQSPFVLLVPRGSRLTRKNLSEYLTNLEPEPRRVSEAFYRDLVETCGRACRDSTRNQDELVAFARRQARVLEDEFAQH